MNDSAMAFLKKVLAVMLSLTVTVMQNLLIMP